MQLLHTLKMRVWDDMVASFYVECPYEEVHDPKRPCRMGQEPDECLWYQYEEGRCHPLCVTASDMFADEACPRADETDGCWTGRVPDECDGWYHPDIGHLHEVGGCWVEFGLGESFGALKTMIENFKVPQMIKIEQYEKESFYVIPATQEEIEADEEARRLPQQEKSHGLSLPLHTGS
jgi:hypothetical protein